MVKIIFKGLDVVVYYITAELIQQKRNHGGLRLGEVVVKPINHTPKKKQKVEVKTNNTSKLYSVSETQEIYLCINAKNQEHDCDFGLCRDCYLKNEPSRKASRKKVDVNESSCNHKCFSSLQQFFDKQFFTSKYMDQVKRRSIAWTSNCKKCGIKFVSMGRNGKIN